MDQPPGHDRNDVKVGVQPNKQKTKLLNHTTYGFKLLKNYRLNLNIK